MKKRDLSDLFKKEKKDLLSKEAEIRKAIVESEIELRLGRLTNPHKIKSIKRDLAQVLTIMKVQQMNKKVEKISDPKGKAKVVKKNVSN